MKTTIYPHHNSTDNHPYVILERTSRSPASRALLHALHQYGPSSFPVIITGPTGSGKELVARSVHHLSRRRNEPLVCINCAGLSGDLVDSQLFGHRKGAFTGALKDFRGAFERAEGGTLFLDEFGELPLATQAKLLRVLDQNTVRPLGSENSIQVNFRLVVATNRNLLRRVEEGHFRLDLYHRVTKLRLTVPPLRDRIEDLPYVVHELLTKITSRDRLPMRSVSPAFIDSLSHYSFEGNIRELEGILVKALLSTPPEEPLIDPSPFMSTGLRKRNVATNAPIPSQRSFEDVCRGYFKNALKRANGKISGTGGAAELTGLAPATLRSKLKKLRIPYRKTEMRAVS